MVVFQQVFILFVFIFAGFLLSRLKVVDREHSKILSGLLVYVFLPCTNFKSFATNFNLDNLREKYPFALVSVIILVVLMILAELISKKMTEHPYQRFVYSYSLTVPNYGYMGYALAASLFGDEGLFCFIIFGIPVTIYIYTIAFCRLTKKPLSAKGLVNPAMISLVLGGIVGMMRLPLPQVAVDILDKASSCMAPVSMLLAGIVISEFDIRSMISDKKVYLLALLRLVVTPVLIGAVVTALCSKEIARCTILFYALPCGLNTIVFPKLVGEDCEVGAKAAFVTNILACFSIPIILHLFHLG